MSRLPDLIYDTKKDLAEHGLVSTIVGHVGDGKCYQLVQGSGSAPVADSPLVGNFHSLLLFRNDEEKALTQEVAKRLVQRAIALDGTCECRRF